MKYGRSNPRRNALRMLAGGAAALFASGARAGLDKGTDPAVVDRLRALDPSRVAADDVAQALAQVPAPRIVLLQGSVPIVTMAPFAEFLIGMGYPAERLRDPRDGSYSMSSFGDSAKLAGTLAWHYEKDGVRPLLIGHSQGGMLAVRVLHELAGEFSPAIPVWNPVSDAAEDRAAIRDPLTGATTPVVGLRLPYAAAIATGALFRVLLGQWTMLSRLRRIPDSVEEFSGFALEGDLIGAGSDPYAATGSAQVRNIALPSSYSHIGLPQAAHLASSAAARAWIDDYVPGSATATPPAHPAFDATNLLHAADIWYSVKRHWCLEARRLAAVRA